MRRPPPSHVVDAFGLTGVVTPTQGPDVWRVGPSALKRVDHQAAVEWICGLLTGRQPASGFRLPTPIAAKDGRWVVDGWAASTWIAGAEDGSRWRAILDTADRFHDWLSDLQRPAWLDDIDDPWRTADRMAWDEQPIEVLPPFVPLIEELASMQGSITPASQLIHGDLTGNVLFAEGLRPGIIDPTLYWRPLGYATAVVAVDCFEWEGVGHDVLDHVAATPDGAQLLVRAALFRIIRAGMETWINAEDRLRVHRRTAAALDSMVR